MFVIILGTVLIILVIYILPPPKVSFQKIYAKAPADAAQSLQAFRSSYPLVEKTLREMLKATYPSAEIKTLRNAGHFPYLNRPEDYSKALGAFFNGS